MKRITEIPPNDLAEMDRPISPAAADELLGNRSALFHPIGLFHDPGMIPAERLDEELAEHWAEDLDRDRE